MITIKRKRSGVRLVKLFMLANNSENTLAFLFEGQRRRETVESEHLNVQILSQQRKRLTTKTTLHLTPRSFHSLSVGQDDSLWQLVVAVFGVVSTLIEESHFVLHVCFELRHRLKLVLNFNKVLLVVDLVMFVPKSFEV